MGFKDWRPAQGEPSSIKVRSSDWRSQLPPGARQRIVNKIMDTLRRHLPVAVPEGMTELKKIAVRFEEKIYTTAVNQSDYLRKISLKMLSMETKTQQNAPMTQPGVNQNSSDTDTSYEIGTFSTAAGIPSEDLAAISTDAQGEPSSMEVPSSDWRSHLQPEARQRIVNKIMDTLRSHLPVAVPEELTELKKVAVRFEEKIYTAADNQSDYLRKISLKLLSMETKTQQNAPMTQPGVNQNSLDTDTSYERGTFSRAAGIPSEDPAAISTALKWNSTRRERM